MQYNKSLYFKNIKNPNMETYEILKNVLRNSKCFTKFLKF